MRPPRRLTPAHMYFGMEILLSSTGRIVGPWRVWGRVLGLVLLTMAVVGGATGQSAPPEDLIKEGERVGAQVELMREVVSRSEQLGLSPEATADLLRPAVQLARQDDPTGPVLTTALEGLAKQVPPARIKATLKRTRRQTERASAIVSAWLEQKEERAHAPTTSLDRPTDREPSQTIRSRLIVNATRAQQQGVSVNEIEQLLQALSERADVQISLSDVAVAVEVLPAVPGRRAAPQAAREVVVAALDAGYEGETLRRLPAVLNRVDRKGMPSAVLARRTAEAIDRGGPPSRVLQRLSLENMPGGSPLDVGRTVTTIPNLGWPLRAGTRPSGGRPFR